VQYEPETPLSVALKGVLTPDCIQKLLDAGDKTLEALYEHIVYVGKAWPHSIPGLGQAEAFAVFAWMRKYAAFLGEYPVLSDSPETAKPALPVAARAEVLAMLPETLSGQFGSNRGTRSIIAAQNDKDAIEAWLHARAVNPNTRAQYRKEAERFLLWTTMELQVALSSVGADEASLYLRWLEALGRSTPQEWAKSWRLPQETWIGPKNAPRLTASWRPFNGPLSPSSRRVAMTSVRLLFSFLTKTGYLRSNPFDLVPAKIPLLSGEGAPKAFADRSLTPRQWQGVLAHLAGLPENLAKARLRVILCLGKGLGMRASEMIEAKAGWIVERRIGDAMLTVIEIVGKGDKVRCLPLSTEILEAINTYFLAREGIPLQAAPKEMPLLLNLSRSKKPQGLSRSGLYKTLTEFFEGVAIELEGKSRADAEKLRASSTHWLRHTFAMSALKAMDINLVQNAMGHASIGTTSRYLAPEEAAVAEAMKQLKTL